MYANDSATRDLIIQGINYLGSSLPDENALAKFIKDYIDDPDCYDELSFSRFYDDIIGKGIPVIWEDML